MKLLRPARDRQRGWDFPAGKRDTDDGPEEDPERSAPGHRLRHLAGEIVEEVAHFRIDTPSFDEVAVPPRGANVTFRLPRNECA